MAFVQPFVEREDWLTHFEAQLPESLLALFHWFEERDWPVYLVGGCLRDAYLGRPVHDFDLACGVPADRLRLACEEAGISMNLSGFAHGTIGMIWRGDQYEITAFRREGTYSDARHPDSVAFTPVLEEDLARRDFTCNAMAWAPSKPLTDPFGGVDDLRAGVLRCVGEARRRFSEDHLRVLRAVRLALELGCSLEAKTEQACEEALEWVADVSGPRQAPEWKRLLVAPYLGKMKEASWLVRLWRICFPFAGQNDMRPEQLCALPVDWRLRLAGACYQALGPEAESEADHVEWDLMTESGAPPQRATYEHEGPGRALAFEMARFLGLNRKERSWIVACLSQNRRTLSDRKLSSNVRWMGRGWNPLSQYDGLWLSGRTRCKLLREMQVRVGHWELLYALQEFGAWKQPALAAFWHWRKHAMQRLAQEGFPMRPEELAVTAQELAAAAGHEIGPWMPLALQFLLECVWKHVRPNEKAALLELALPVYLSAVWE